MDMTSNVPGWLTPLAWVWLGLTFASTAALAYDIVRRGHRSVHLADDLVWLGSALYLGPYALVLHRRSGRADDPVATGDPVRPRPDRRPSTADVLPGGSASALAHIIGVPFVIATGWTIAGLDLWVMILVIGVLATALLVLHQRWTGAGPLGAAVGVATLTVLGFDVGMGAWMVLLHLYGLMPAATEATFWFLMQIGVVLGLITGYPVVARLSRVDRGLAPAGS